MGRGHFLKIMMGLGLFLNHLEQVLESHLASRASSRVSKCSNKSLQLTAQKAGLKAEAEAIKKFNKSELKMRLLKKEKKFVR